MEILKSNTFEEVIKFIGKLNLYGDFTLGVLDGYKLENWIMTSFGEDMGI